jgi:Tol biopolymer transport system component
MFKSRRMVGNTFGILSMILLVTACGHGNTAPTPEIPENSALLQNLTGKIVFVSTWNEQSTIKVMSPDGAGLTNLVEATQRINSFTLSPSGGLLYDLYDGRYWAIHAVTGGTDRRLTSGQSSDLYPAWSPDGTQIMFTSYRDNHDELYLMNVDGSGLQRLTSGAGSEKCAWSPDGRYVVFVSEREGSEQIYRMNRDGSDVRRLTALEAQNIFPAWSPDGTQIAFASARDGNYEIYVMNADGSAPRRLTFTVADNVQPAWSPDGRFIVFSSNREVTSALYVVAVSNGSFVKLPQQGSNTSPLWMRS